MTETSQGEVWIGLVHVKPEMGCTVLGDEPGAWVNIVALAGTIKEYRKKVHDAVRHYSLELREIEDAETLEQRASRSTVDPELLKLASEVRRTGFARFGTFHTYRDDGSPTH